MDKHIVIKKVITNIIDLFLFELIFMFSPPFNGYFKIGCSNNKIKANKNK
jgi:hypothetical protein